MRYIKINTHNAHWYKWLNKQINEKLFHIIEFQLIIIKEILKI